MNFAMSTLFGLLLFAALILALNAYANHECPNSRSHRILCPAHKPLEMVMKCSTWAGLVASLHKIAPERRYMEAQRQLSSVRNENNQKYLRIFAIDALKFLEVHETEEEKYKNAEHAFAAAMLACGYWDGT